MQILKASAESISFNAMRKIYPDGSSDILVADRALFRAPGWEAQKKAKRSEAADGLQLDFSNEIDYIIAEEAGKRLEGRLKASDEIAEENKARSMRRARAKLRDLALSSDFSWFVTLTLAREKIDRYDDREVIRRLNTWLDNRVRRKGLAYVLVPERHKDGAIHFHGFINAALNDSMVASGHRDKGGHEIFNCEAWDFGFTTAMRLYGEYSQAVAYVCKYIGKQTEKIGGRWYYSGGKLGAPEVERFDLSLDEVEKLPGAYSFTTDSGIQMVLVRFGSNGEPKVNRG